MAFSPLLLGGIGKSTRLGYGYVNTTRVGKTVGMMHYTVKVEISALYLFSHNLRFFNILENIYTMKTTFIIAQKANNTSNENSNAIGIAHFVKFAEMYTCENIYVHSIHYVKIDLKELKGLDREPLKYCKGNGKLTF